MPPQGDALAAEVVQVADAAADAAVNVVAKISDGETTRVEEAVLYDETLVHLPCLMHLLAAPPQQGQHTDGTGARKQLSALVIFGGDGSALKEILKYGRDVTSVTVLDHDEAVGAVGESDVHWIVGDVGETLVKLTSGGNELLKRYDIIIVDLAKQTSRPNEPLSRDDAARIAMLLEKDGGVIAFGSTSPVCPMQTMMKMLMPSGSILRFGGDHGFNVMIVSTNKNMVQIPTVDEATARLQRDNIMVTSGHLFFDGIHQAK